MTEPYYQDDWVRNPKSEPALRYNESSPGGWWNTRRSLTHSLDLTKEGLMPNSIRSALAESNAAKTACPSGHPYDEGNTYVRPSDGARLCRECTRARGREAYRRRMASRKQAPPTQPTGVRALDRNIGAADASGCWRWGGYVSESGYGVARVDGKSKPAHRAVHVALVGTIPQGLDLDHLCRVRDCVNPDHLEPVTRRVNVLRGVGAGAQNARKTHCIKGHPLDGDNLVSWARNRLCRECYRERDRIKARARRARARAAA